jgi:FixJ family two-component response regulator
MRMLRPVRIAGPPLKMDNNVIAIVDDDALVRDGLQRLVDSMNFRAEQFSSIDQFLTFKCLSEVRCVICDVETESGDTTELLLHQLASIGHNIPIVFMTARPSAAMRARLLGAGALQVLTKPVHQSEMATCLTAALERFDKESQQTRTHSPSGNCNSPRACPAK